MVHSWQISIEAYSGEKLRILPLKIQSLFADLGAARESRPRARKRKSAARRPVVVPGVVPVVLGVFRLWNNLASACLDI